MPTVEDWMIKLTEFAEMAKVASLIRAKTILFFFQRQEALSGLFAERREEQTDDLAIGGLKMR